MLSMFDTSRFSLPPPTNGPMALPNMTLQVRELPQILRTNMMNATNGIRTIGGFDNSERMKNTSFADDPEIVRRNRTYMIVGGGILASIILYKIAR